MRQQGRRRDLVKRRKDWRATLAPGLGCQSTDGKMPQHGKAEGGRGRSLPTALGSPRAIIVIVV